MAATRHSWHSRGAIRWGASIHTRNSTQNTNTDARARAKHCGSAHVRIYYVARVDDDMSRASEDEDAWFDAG